MKELVMEVTSSLPDNATLEEIICAIYERVKIEQGLKDAQKGNLLSEDEALREIESWL
ncbi:MAG: hypothetical protein IJS47_04350 [Clostridia bacterium]|nr:hypothetical protein [Clostridia bacterium]